MILLTIGVSLHQLVESHALTAGLRDASTSSLGKLECGNSHLRNVKDTLVVSDGGDNDSNILHVRLLLVVLDELGQRHWGLVGARSNESSQDHLPDALVSPPRHEPEQLDEQVDVEVGAASVFLVRILNSTSLDEINSLKYQ